MVGYRSSHLPAVVFTSHLFVFYFLPAVLAAYYLLPGRRRNAFLTLASYVFYGWWNPWFVTLMLASTVVDYRCGKAVAAPGASRRRRRLAVAASVTANLGLLGFFKYWMFFAANVNAVAAELGPWRLPDWRIVLPIGISFYTFQSMSYTLDLYRGRARPADSLLDFAAYVSLFPQLIAGPIIRYRDLAGQLPERRHSLDGMARGLATFAFGFAKKVLLANNLGVVADAAFAAGAPPWHVAWVGVVAYAFQIYFDFSGYSDMAIGLGRMFGFRFPENFRSPYRAASITDFWRRWHISLSTWLRDYLYIPLGGNRKGKVRTYVNLAITMLLGGLWHGAQWQFVIWGGLHGLMLAAERARGKTTVPPEGGERNIGAGLPRPLRVAATFVLVLITWVFFRAANLADALDYLAAMFGLATNTAASELTQARVFSPSALATLVAGALIIWWAPRTAQLVGGDGRRGDDRDAVYRSPAGALALAALFVLALAEMSVQGHNPFLYFQF